MSTQTTQDFHSVVKSRHSVRQYDSSVKISKEEMTEILQEAILAPSSSNLQPWRFLVIEQEDLKKKLHPIAFNQGQVLQASAVIAVFGDMEWYEHAEEIYSDAVKAGFMTEEVKQAFIASAENVYRHMDEERKKSILYTDGGLVSMQLMLSARAKGYDTVPMGGYDKIKLHEEFNIPTHYESIMLIAIGKAEGPVHPTSRLPLEKVTYWNEMK
ncbi:nitroreductase [Paenibacillus sp. DS2015]|uniref:nitroreductase family protein n=1 Tax=Paenibacillus sp. DS2015 TaxID=3373917 RepID=UPI003D229E5C